MHNYLKPLFIFIVIANFYCLQIDFKPDQLVLLLDSLGDDLRLFDHNYTIISLVLDMSTLEFDNKTTSITRT